MAASTAARAGALPSVATSTGNPRWGMALLAYTRIATLPSVPDPGGTWGLPGFCRGDRACRPRRPGCTVAPRPGWRSKSEGGEMRTVADLKARVCAEIDRRKGEIVAISEHIMKHPESGYREVRTA